MTSGPHYPVLGQAPSPDHSPALCVAQAWLPEQEVEPVATALRCQLEIAVQVMGKLRGTVKVARDASSEDVQAAVMADERIAKHLSGKQVIKVIHVPNRLMSFVIEM